jgi:hypothetical protein
MGACSVLATVASDGPRYARVVNFVFALVLLAVGCLPAECRRRARAGRSALLNGGCAFHAVPESSGYGQVRLTATPAHGKLIPIDHEEAPKAMATALSGVSKVETMRPSDFAIFLLHPASPVRHGLLGA